MEEERKEELITNLYALRAGLSVVSGESDIAAQILEEANQQLKNKDDELACQRQMVEESTNKIRVRLRKEEDELARNKRTSLSKSDSKAAYVGTGVGGTFLFFLGLAMLIGFIYTIVLLYVIARGFGENWRDIHVLYFFYSGWGDRLDNASNGAVIGGIALLVVLISGGITCLKYAIKFWCISARNGSKHKSWKLERNHALHQMVAVNVPKINQLKEELRVAERKAIIALDEYDEIAQRNHEAHTEELKKMNVHVQAGMEVYQLLKKTFSSYIDERDWESLDYLIYALETRRADTMKEALQLLDKARQTNRIVETVSSASQEISRTLNAGFQNMQEQLETCYYQLSDQIAQSTRAIVGGLEVVVHAQQYQTSVLSSQIAYLTSVQSMNNALLAKANEGSAELIRDIHHLRVLADSHP